MYNMIYLGGTFDCLHRGHLNLFRNARLRAREVCVSLNTDDFATRYKRKPMQSFADRYDVLNECKLVDLLIVNTGGEDSKPSILFSGADAVGHGADWVGESLIRQLGLTFEWLEEHHIHMVYLPYTEGISSTSIREGVKT